MEPIISPWFFYVLGVIEGIQSLFGVTGGVLLVVSLATIIPMAIEYDLRKTMKWHALGSIVGVVFITVAILIPTKETVIQMAVAKQVTPDNITTITNIGKAVKDEAKADILDILKSLKGDAD